MKKASGYITADGSFFEKEEDATLHEAEMRLRARLAVDFSVVDPERFMGIVIALSTELKEYLNAYPYKRTDAEDTDGEKTGNGQEAKADDGLGHIDSAEEDLASLLKLPPRGPEHVPDVGSRSRTEKVSDGRAKHGSGVRGKDARGVRSS